MLPARLGQAEDKWLWERMEDQMEKVGTAADEVTGLTRSIRNWLAGGLVVSGVVGLFSLWLWASRR